MMVMQAGLGMPPSEVVDYINAVVEVIVQLKRGEHGVRFISEIYYKHKKKFEKQLKILLIYILIHMLKKAISFFL